MNFSIGLLIPENQVGSFDNALVIVTYFVQRQKCTSSHSAFQLVGTLKFSFSSPVFFFLQSFSILVNQIIFSKLHPKSQKSFLMVPATHFSVSDIFKKSHSNSQNAAKHSVTHFFSNSEKFNHFSYNSVFSDSCSLFSSAAVTFSKNLHAMS